MGPRFVNRACHHHSHRQGKTPDLQWGRGLLTADVWCRCASITVVQHLQWGRGLLTADVSPLHLPAPDPPSSMGPRFVNRGCAHHLQHHNREVPSSMGPRFVNRGCPGTRHGASIFCPSSMGPRFVNRGCRQSVKCQSQCHCSSMGPRFVNRGCGVGAGKSTTERQLQWGRGLLTADVPAGLSLHSCQLCFNGAAVC